MRGGCKSNKPGGESHLSNVFANDSSRCVSSFPKWKKNFSYLSSKRIAPLHIRRYFPACFLGQLYLLFPPLFSLWKPLAAGALFQAGPGHGGCSRVCFTVQTRAKFYSSTPTSSLARASPQNIWLEVTRASCSGYKQNKNEPGHLF